MRRVNHELMHRNDIVEFIDEIKIYYDIKWVNFCEIAWKFLSLKTRKIKLSINRFQIHLKNQQRLLINLNDFIIAQTLQINEKYRQITLIEYFKMNKRTQQIEQKNNLSSYEHNIVVKDFKNYFITIFLSISFETNDWRFEKFEKKINALIASISWVSRSIRFSIYDYCCSIKRNARRSRIYVSSLFKSKMLKMRKRNYDLWKFTWMFA